MAPKKEKNVGGRPIEFTPKRIEEIKKLMDDYTNATEIPIVAEFAYINNLSRQSLYEQPGLSDSRKHMLDKKEVALERNGLTGDVNTTMAIFSLKQLGWTDKQEIKNTGELSIIDVLNQAHKKNTDE